MVWTSALSPIIVQVKALGLKCVESHMRKGEWEEYMRVTVLECVLLVTACPDGKFAVGTKVVATFYARRDGLRPFASFSIH